MTIDKGSFLLALATFGVGGAGGYMASEQGVLKRAEAPGVTEPQGTSTAVVPQASRSDLPRAEPLCDDTIGAPGTCPPPGYPAEEGGCGNLATKRCEDFKQAMKPRIAAQAVACLDALTPAQRCDPARINLCGHEALMNACSEADAPSTTSAGPSDELGSRCDSIARACGSSATVAPPMRECRATLAGLNAIGRDKMAACMSAHCGDKGLAGCEAVMDGK
jgi:hypothetical protein